MSKTKKRGKKGTVKTTSTKEKKRAAKETGAREEDKTGIVYLMQHSHPQSFP